MLADAIGKTILALGDSYTIGVGVSENERWTNQLVQRLNSQDLFFGPPKVVAENGWSTDELQAAIAEADLKKTYDWVTLLIGVNNQYRGWPLSSFEKEFYELLGYSIERANGLSSRVIVLSIPDWGVTPFAKDRDTGKIAKEINAFNDCKAACSQKLKTHFVDVTGLSRQAKHSPELLADDGLHPSSKMYANWVDRVAPVITEHYQTEHCQSKD